MSAGPVRPAYEGACVSRIVPAVLGETDRSWLPQAARDARAVVLLLIDGLGWRIIERNRSPSRPLVDGRRLDNNGRSVHDALGADVAYDIAQSGGARDRR